MFRKSDARGRIFICLYLVLSPFFVEKYSFSSRLLSGCGHPALTGPSSPSYTPSSFSGKSIYHPFTTVLASSHGIPGRHTSTEHDGKASRALASAKYSTESQHATTDGRAGHVLTSSPNYSPARLSSSISHAQLASNSNASILHSSNTLSPRSTDTPK